MTKFKEILTGSINEKSMTSEEREEYYRVTDKAMAEFTKGLEKLTKKTGISLDVTGSLFWDEPKGIKSVSYSNDFSSGDMSVDVKLK